MLGAGGIVGHLNAFQKERLGWLNYGSSPIVQTVTTTNDYWIDNFSTLGGSVKGLKIANGSGYYYLESRDRVGFDANVPAGVTLHTGTTSSSDSSYQIDLAPDTTSWDSTLDVGQTVRDATLGVTISTVSTGLTGALIRVTFGSTSCAAAAPAVSITPSSQSGAAGSTLNYTITVTNKNGTGCAASTFSLSAAAPSGWSASYSPAGLSLAPGTSASSTLSLTLPATASGTSTFSVAATDGTGGLKGTASGTASAIAATTTISATVSADISIKGNNRAANITVVAKTGSQPLAGAPVTVTVTTSAGTTIKLSATTDSTGKAVAKYSLKPKDPSGTYTAQAVVSSGSATASASTSFVVP